MPGGRSEPRHESEHQAMSVILPCIRSTLDIFRRKR
jgi:hypothetical protein